MKNHHMVKCLVIAILSIVTVLKLAAPGDITVEISYTYIKADVSTFFFFIP